MEVQDVVTTGGTQDLDDPEALLVALNGNEDHVTAVLERALVSLQRLAFVRASLEQSQQPCAPAVSSAGPGEDARSRLPRQQVDLRHVDPVPLKSVQSSPNVFRSLQSGWVFIVNSFKR
jgi:hypothetical protein